MCRWEGSAVCHLLQQITQRQALVHGISKGSSPGDTYTLLTAKHYTGDTGDDCAYP